MKSISPRKVLTAMIRCEGSIRLAAEMLHTQPRNVSRILDEHPEIQTELDDCHIGLMDEALRSAKELVENRDREMTKFVIDRLGDKRGIHRPKKEVVVGGDANNPLITKQSVDLSTLSDEELDTLGKILREGRNGAE